MEGESEGFCSALSLFELKRLGLKGTIPKVAIDSLIEAIPAICGIQWIYELELLRLAARLNHALGIPAMDSLILAGLIEAGSEIIYTTDSHLESYKKRGISVVNLCKGISR